MEIRTVTFESGLVITLENNQTVVITPFKTPEHGVYKLGISAPKQVPVNRLEIYIKKQDQLKNSVVPESGDELKRSQSMPV